MSASVRKASLSLSLLAVLAGDVARAQVTQRVSVDSQGVEADEVSSWPTISATGRFVAFVSGADNLDGASPWSGSIFVHDRLTGTTERVNTDAAGVPGAASAYFPRISGDGRYVAFISQATNLVAGDTDAADDVFLKDRWSGAIEIASLPAPGGTLNTDAIVGGITPDARFVAFHTTSEAEPGDTTFRDVYVRDRQTGQTTRVSRGLAGSPTNGHSVDASLSDDGRFVSFVSAASNLVVGDTNGREDVFVHDRQTGTTTRVSVSSAGVEGDAESHQPAPLSADGRFVVFHSEATNLVANGTNGWGDVYVHDRLTAQTTLVSASSAGVPGDNGSELPSISADGRTVSFLSYATNLTPGVPTGDIVFVRDLASGSTTRAAVSSSGVPGNGFSESAVLSADGRYVTFWSSSTNLVPGDLNHEIDVFVHDRSAAGFTSLCEAGTAGVLACPCGNPPAGPGRGCDNSAATGGARLSASGAAYLAADSLVLSTSGELATATSVVLQGSAVVASGTVFGQGVRCAAGTLSRLYVASAVGGGTSAPGAGDPSVSARSAALGSPISAGESRWYLVYYRDPFVLGGCPAASTFNATQTGRVTWWP